MKHTEKPRSNFAHQATSFAWLFVAYSYACIIAYLTTDHALHLALVWNVFLAFFPLLLSLRVIASETKQSSTKNHWPTIIFLILWLLFFPNAIYVITDVIHLSELSFYTGNYYAVTDVSYTRDIANWIELLTIVSGIFLSLIMGLLSLRHIHIFLSKHLSKTKMWLVIVSVAFLTGIALYIGRFLRFNSWDTFIQPHRILVELWQSLDQFALIFIGATTIMIVFFYLIFRRLELVFRHNRS